MLILSEFFDLLPFLSFTFFVFDDSLFVLARQRYKIFMDYQLPIINYFVPLHRHANKTAVFHYHEYTSDSMLRDEIRS